MTRIDEVNRDVARSVRKARTTIDRRISWIKRRWDGTKGPLRQFAFEYVFRNPYQFSVPGEIGIYSERRNLVSIVWPLVAELVTFCAAVVAMLLLPSLSVVFAIVGLLSLLAFTYGLIEWFVTRLFISDRRMYEITGFFSVKVDVLPLSKVTDMTYTQSFVGRMFRYGHVRVETAGQDQALSNIQYLRRPEEVYKVATALALGKEWKRVTKVLRLAADVPFDMAADARADAAVARRAEEAKRAEAEAERSRAEQERLKVEQDRLAVQNEWERLRAERRRLEHRRLADEAEHARQAGIGRPAEVQELNDRLVVAGEAARLAELSAQSAEAQRRETELERRRAQQERQLVEQKRITGEEAQRKQDAALGSVDGQFDTELEKARKGTEDSQAEEEFDQVLAERHRQADEWARVVNERERINELYERMKSERRRIEVELRRAEEPGFAPQWHEEEEFIDEEQRLADRERELSELERRRAEDERRRLAVEQERAVVERARLRDLGGPARAAARAPRDPVIDRGPAGAEAAQPEFFDKAATVDRSSRSEGRRPTRVDRAPRDQSDWDGH